jgi:rhodanese-related sulfurtransferase
MGLKRKFFLSLIASLTLGLAPFTPEPHLFGKIKWVLGGGEGMALTDYWDLIMHGAPWLFLIYFGFKLLTGGDKTAAIIKEALEKTDTVIIDVREPNEYNSGHAENAVNMPLSSFGSFIPKIKKMPGTKLLYCRSGMRSANATSQLKKAGVENVVNVGTAGALK